MYRFNKVFLEGNLAADPKLKIVGKSTSLVELKLAVDRPRKIVQTADSKIEVKDRTDVDFIKIIAWNALAEQCSKNLKKGDGIFIEGVLRTRAIIDNEGVNRRILEVVAKDVRFGIRKRDPQVTEVDIDLGTDDTEQD